MDPPPTNPTAITHPAPTPTPFPSNPQLPKPTAQPPPPHHLDTITLRNLTTTATIGPDAWSRPSKPQPLLLTINLLIDTSSAGSSDNINHTFSYGTLCKDLLGLVESDIRRDFGSLDGLVEGIARLAEQWPGEELRIEAKAPKALLRVEGGLGRVVCLRRGKGKEGDGKGREWCIQSQAWMIRGLKIPCIIGVNPHERLEKQTVVVEFITQCQSDTDSEDQPLIQQARGGGEIWRGMVKRVCEVVEPSSFQTLEALAALVARTVLEGGVVREVKVGVEKPSALASVEGAGVEIWRDRRWAEGLGEGG